MRDRLLQVEKTTGKLPQLLKDEPILDWRIEPAFDAYQSMQKYRKFEVMPFGGIVWQPLTASEILDWMKLERNRLPFLFVITIKELDRVFIDFVSAAHKSDSTDTKSSNKVNGSKAGIGRKTRS